ncbi:protein kinase domain-containing protein [Egibacter rhizosphaerae]|nr:protein kinase [Egibacter rhizosphaerae]
MTQEDRTSALPAGATPTPTSGPPVPQVLARRYVLEERIAVGGMAEVWRAHDRTLARTVAVKILHEHLSADDAFRERFRREAVAAAKLGHPGVVAIFDTGDDAGWTYLVMEYVEGVTLKERVAEEGPLPLEDVASLAEQVAAALADAHLHGLVHRDVKPANILWAPDGIVKVADFGIAKAAQSSRDLTQTGTLLGTATYIAPEQVRGEPLDGRADQYAFACVLYEALTGTPPFLGNSTMETATMRLQEDPLPARSLRPDVPEAIEAALATALTVDPADRHRSVLELGWTFHPWAQRIAESSDDSTEASPPAEPPEGVPPPSTTNDTAESADAQASPRRFRRVEGAWLASVLASLAVVATLAAVGLASGLVDVDRIPRLVAEVVEGDDEADEETPVEIGAGDLTAFDPPEVEDYPGGNNVERDEQLPNLLDADASTFWRTELYEDAEFEGQKPGVGFTADLGEAHELAEITLHTPSDGISFEVRVADEPSDDVDDWETLDEVSGADSVEVIEGDGVEARYVLVYVVPPLVEPDFDGDDGQYAAAFSVLDIRGEPP